MPANRSRRKDNSSDPPSTWRLASVPSPRKVSCWSPTSCADWSAPAHRFPSSTEARSSSKASSNRCASSRFRGRPRLNRLPLIRDAFGPGLRTLDPAHRTALVGGLPHLSLLFGGLGMTAPPAIGDAALEKTRLFEDVSRLLERLARQAPTTILLDDLQWADPASIELLL